MSVGEVGRPRMAGRQLQIQPVDYAVEMSQKLVDAAHRGDLATAMYCLANPTVDINYAGAVRFKGRRATLVPREEAASLVHFEWEELLTIVSPLFLAAHSGDLSLLRKLLRLGANVNQKLFRGYAMTAAVREGREEVVEVLLKAGAGQDSCEEALLEASRYGRERLVELIMGSELIRPRVAVHALVTAASHGFVEVVETFVRLGVDANAVDRMLLQSLKPFLHLNANCTTLVAAVVSRQVAVVRQLLEAGVRTDVLVRLGAWSWDVATGEECRVGAGLGEPYDVAWCAVEFFESTGAILRLLLSGRSPDSLNLGRSLLHHAILCGCPASADVLLASGADFELPVRTTLTEFRPIHMAARLGQPEILHNLINRGCDLNARTDAGETALMLSARYQQASCVTILAAAGADFGLVNSVGASASILAAHARWSLGFRKAVIEAVHSGTIPRSSDSSVFTLMTFVAKYGDVTLLETLLKHPELICIDEQDENGLSAAMVAAREGNVDAFRLLVFSGADVQLKSKSKETAVTFYRSSKKKDLFEQVMLEYALEKGEMEKWNFYEAQHCAARLGDLTAMRRLLEYKEHDVNVPDCEGYTPLMLAAREAHGAMCELLIASGAQCDARNPRGETALSLAQAKGGLKNKAEEVIMDELARRLVVGGGRVKKHTKKGRGSPHRKSLRMVEERGVLRWGRSRRRNVVCKSAEKGGSEAFQRNRRKKGDGFEKGLFRVVTSKRREVHFVCEGGDEEAELWVRGIMLVTGSVFGATNSVLERR